MQCKLYREEQLVETMEINGYKYEKKILTLEMSVSIEFESKEMVNTSDFIFFSLTDTIHIQDSPNFIEDYIAKMKFERKIDEESFFDKIEIYNDSKLEFEFKSFPEKRKTLIQKLQSEIQQKMETSMKIQNKICIIFLIILGSFIILLSFQITRIMSEQTEYYLSLSVIIIFFISCFLIIKTIYSGLSNLSKKSREQIKIIQIR